MHVRVIRYVVISLAALISVSISGVASAQPAPAAGQAPAAAARPAPQPPLLMTSTAWEDGGVIPDKFTQAVQKLISDEIAHVFAALRPCRVLMPVPVPPSIVPAMDPAAPRMNVSAPVPPVRLSKKLNVTVVGLSEV